MHFVHAVNEDYILRADSQRGAYTELYYITGGSARGKKSEAKNMADLPLLTP